MRKILPIAIGLFFLLAASAPVRAQSAASVQLFGLDTSDFPAMTAMLDIYDPAGNFVSGLTTAEVNVLEEDRTCPLEALTELKPGAQFVVAINPGAAFATRDSYGVTRYDKVARALQDWAASRPPDSADDLSLVITGGETSAHLKAAKSFLNGLSAYRLDQQNLAPTLDNLSQALDIASVPTPQPGMKRAVLFITSPPEAAVLPVLQNLTARAAGLGIRVDVWILTSVDFFTTAGATALKDLAIQTGGGYFLFSGDETLPSPEIYLTPLRHTYRLTYMSGITTPGSHSLAAQISLNGQPVTSPVLTFNLDVQPPNPILVAPPEQVVRRFPKAAVTDSSTLQPVQQLIEIIIEFPDGHPRSLVSTTLYVDGRSVAENQAAPFDEFTWDLRSYTSSGQHTLQVEAVDSLGLSKISLGLPVTITVVQPMRGLLAFLSRNSLWVVAGAVLLAGAVLGLTLARGRIRRRGGTAGRISRTDPLTQPVPGEPGRRSLPLPWTRAGRIPPAYLVRLKEDGEPVTTPPIPLVEAEVIFGTDPIQATRLLNDPSVSPRHARLTQAEDGSYTLADEKSVAGTWVNFEQVLEPRRLQHGDIIHIGQVSYRFLLRKPPERPKPHVLPKTP